LRHLVFAFAFQPGGGDPHAWCVLIAPTRMTLMFWVDFAVYTGAKSTRNHFGHLRLRFWVYFAVYAGVKSTRNPSALSSFRAAARWATESGLRESPHGLGSEHAEAL